MKIIVGKKPVPPSSLIARALSRVDYADNYCTSFKSSRIFTTVDIAQAFFRSFPAWVVVLIGIRQTIAKVLRLRTGESPGAENDICRFTGEPGQAISVFEVFGSKEGELLMGADDRHLDFRLSFFLEKEGKRYDVSAATTVKFNGWLGRAYFVPVGPLHRIIMPALLRRMIKTRLAEHESCAAR